MHRVLPGLSWLVRAFRNVCGASLRAVKQRSRKLTQLENRIQDTFSTSFSTDLRESEQTSGLVELLEMEDHERVVFMEQDEPTWEWITQDQVIIKVWESMF